jgi:hypothetical protein
MHKVTQTKTSSIVKNITHTLAVAGLLLSAFASLNMPAAPALAATQQQPQQPGQAEAQQQPLARWHSAGNGQIDPLIKATEVVTDVTVTPATPTVTATATTPAQTETPSMTQTAVATVDPTTTVTPPTATATKGTPTPTPTKTPYYTRTPTHTPTTTPTRTPSPTATRKPTNTPSPTPKPNLNYRVDAIEITQAIQDLNNSVVLVKDKPTWARVHVRSNVAAKHWITARLYRIVNGQRADVVFPSNGWIVPKVNPNRGLLNDSFYFALPAAWVAQPNLTVEAEINPADTAGNRNPRESTYADNVLRTAVNLQATPPMHLNVYLVRYRSGFNLYQAGVGQANDLYDWLRRAYPVHSIDFKVFWMDMTWLGRLPTCSEVNSMLLRVRFWRQRFGQDVRQTRYYGQRPHRPAHTVVGY